MIRFKIILVGSMVQSETEMVIIADLQRGSFSSEYNRLLKGQAVHRHGNLRTLTPFLDDQGVIRVGGRLQRAAFPVSKRYPINLPERSDIRRLIVLAAHKEMMHGGAQVTLNCVRRKYWLLGSLRVVKSVLKSCVNCFRSAPRPVQQLMGSLHVARVQFSKSFLCSGFDFAGLFRFRISTGRGTRSTKGYIAVFVCLSTKAFHLEPVSTKRFVSGRPHAIS